MKSIATPPFWRCFHELPLRIQDQAERAFALWQSNPSHRSLEFKRVHPRLQIVSVRIGMQYRAVGERNGETITWFWIGSHAAYDQLLKRL
jgi:hypothetical protein